ncbi:MAG TPA: hypothetical protein VGM37_17810 [Armatimonadota bacterium]|jgi:hypothetical protein
MPNPLREYRRTQRAIREQFEPFTDSHCPTCPDPCCRKPARVDDRDVLLAESLGYALPPGDPAADRAEAAVQLLQIGTVSPFNSEPCDYLLERGCAFPPDLRPLGCTTYVCKFMERDMSSRELREIKRLGKRLEDQRAALLKAVGVK